MSLGSRLSRPCRLGHRQTSVLLPKVAHDVQVAEGPGLRVYTTELTTLADCLTNSDRQVMELVVTPADSGVTESFLDGPRAGSPGRGFRVPVRL